MSRVTECRSCGADIYFHKSASGKWYPTNSPDNRKDFHKCLRHHEVPKKAERTQMDFNFSEVDGARQVGAVLIFKPGTSLAEAKRAIANSPELMAILSRVWKNEKTGNHDAPASVQEYNPEHGHPVFYIP